MNDDELIDDIDPITGLPRDKKPVSDDELAEEGVEDEDAADLSATDVDEDGM